MMIRTFSLVICTYIVLFLIGCDSPKKVSKLHFVAPEAGTIVRSGQPLWLSLSIPESTEAIDSILYLMDGQVIHKASSGDSVQLDLEGFAYGSRSLSAQIFSSSGEEVTHSNVVHLPPAPQFYGFRVVQEYPHNEEAFTQGLELHGGYLYESTGQYDNSSLRRTDLQTGRILQKTDLPGQYFAEGMTIIDDRIIQLTWQEGVGFVYDRNTLTKTDQFTYGTNREGWGICYDGSRLIASDGTNKLYFINPDTYKDEGTLSVYNHQGPVNHLNELEYIDGLVYANVYQEDIIVIIDPSTGAVVGEINLMGLYPEMAAMPYDHELNGIAYDRSQKKLYVTGKKWPKLFEIELIPR